MTSWTARARDIRPGDRYRILGPGYQSRAALAVACMCNCQNPRGGSVVPAGQPAPPCPPGHNATYPGDGARADHYSVVVITTAGGGTATIPPHWPVTLTSDPW